MKKSSYKALLSGKAPEPAPPGRLREDVNEILNKVAKEDKLVALGRQRAATTFGDEDRTAEMLLKLLKKGLRAVE